MNATPPTIDQILSNLKIASLNQMQLEALEADDKHSDVIILSPTGSGKTLAFLLPTYQTLKPDVSDIQSLIIVPSRELALQIEQVFKQMKTGYKVNTCYGGHEIDIEENNFSVPPSLLIGTPGRICDHIQRKNIDLSVVKTLVLDEFDKSLEMGFQEEMGFIIKHLKNVKKRILTSATQAIRIPDFTGLQNPFTLNYIDKSNSSLIFKIVKAIDQNKLETLFQLICQIGNIATIVFCNQRDEVEEVCEYLSSKGIINSNFHGGLEQRYRESTLTKFRNGSCNFLITTDLAARGLDIPAVKYVIHYQLPPKEDAFIHRNGRTARMDAKGTSILLLNTNDHLPDYFNDKIENLTLDKKSNIPDLPEWETLFIGGGKKDKINKVDIVGFLSQKGNLKKDELGLIEVKDGFAYAAVKRDKIKEVIKLVRNEKIKNQKLKIEIARETPKFEPEN